MDLLTPIHAVLVYPLRELDSVGLERSGWQAGPLPYAVHVGREEFPPERQPPFLQRTKRVGIYGDPEPAERLFDRRWWRAVSIPDAHVRVLAAELVEHRSTWSEVVAHLILHVECPTGSARSEGPSRLAKLARPGTRFAQTILSALHDDVTWELAPASRVGTMALSATPSPGEQGLVCWPDQDPREGRLVDLVVLPSDKADTSGRFDPGIERPTPSYELAASGASVAIVRLRPVKDAHVVKLRSLWLDAYLLELCQREELDGLAKVMRDQTGRSADWLAIADAFRRFRLQDLWSASTDHPLEAALARRLRTELRTDELADRIQAELDDHAAAAQTMSTDRLNLAVLILAVASIVVPLVLQLSHRDWDGPYVAALALGALFAAAVGALWVRSGRS